MKKKGVKNLQGFQPLHFQLMLKLHRSHENIEMLGISPPILGFPFFGDRSHFSKVIQDRQHFLCCYEKKKA